LRLHLCKGCNFCCRNDIFQIKNFRKRTVPDIIHFFHLSHVYFLTKLPIEWIWNSKKGTLSKVSARRCVSAGIIRFVCRGSSTGRTEQFWNRINLLPSIGCPRHCRDARGFFILRPSLLLLRRGLASIVSSKK